MTRTRPASLTVFLLATVLLTADVSGQEKLPHDGQKKLVNWLKSNSGRATYDGSAIVGVGKLRNGLPNCKIDFSPSEEMKKRFRQRQNIPPKPGEVTISLPTFRSSR